MFLEVMFLEVMFLECTGCCKVILQQPVVMLW
jgi:hypothetical protein